LTAVYEREPYRFEHDPELTARIIDAFTTRDAFVILDLIDGFRMIGFDARSTAMEIGILIADGRIRAVDPKAPLTRWTVVELAPTGDGELSASD